MLRKMKNILDKKTLGKDGELGKTGDFLFDDEDWMIRYLVVKTGHFLNRKELLVFPPAIENEKITEDSITLNMTKEQIENSPDIDKDQPLSRKAENELFTYFGWAPYWSPLSIKDGKSAISRWIPASFYRGRKA